METLITWVDERLSNHDTAIWNLEKQVGQTATTLLEWPQEAPKSCSDKTARKTVNATSIRSEIYQLNIVKIPSMGLSQRKLAGQGAKD